MPFFVAASDYCLIGEELFAAAAYLSKDQVQLGSILGQDVSKPSYRRCVDRGHREAAGLRLFLYAPQVMKGVALLNVRTADSGDVYNRSYSDPGFFLTTNP